MDNLDVTTGYFVEFGEKSEIVRERMEALGYDMDGDGIAKFVIDTVTYRNSGKNKGSMDRVLQTIRDNPDTFSSLSSAGQTILFNMLKRKRARK